MTLIALIFFDSENMRNNEKVRKKCFMQITQITQIFLNTNRSNNTNIFLIPKTWERAKKHENILFVRLVRLEFFFFEHESILKSATIIQYTIKGRFMSR